MEEKKIKSNLNTYIDLLPLSGLMISIALIVYFYYINDLKVEVINVMYVYLPFIIMTIFSYFIKSIMNKINILPQLILIFISIAMIVFSNQASREELVEINLDGFIEKLESEQEIYGIFISDNCVYCNEMEDIYIWSFRKHIGLKSI